jgi:penicillin-binding protein 2
MTAPSISPLLRALILLLAASLVGCTALAPPSTVTPPPPPTSTPETPDAGGTAAAFLQLWEAGDYRGMYSLLSPLSQDAIGLGDFEARYAGIARTASLVGVETRVLSVLKSGQTAKALFEVSLHTNAVGAVTRKIEMELVFIGERWAIAWTEGLILPELVGGNTLLMEYVVPARANIYDRNGLGLAAQGEAVAIGVQPNQITNESAVLEALSELLGQRPQTIRAKIANARPDWYVPIGEASAADVQMRLSTLSALGGVFLSRYSTRFYPNGGVAPHVLGHMGAIPPEQLADYQALGYTGDERVGISGLEAWAEPYLAGVRGGKLSVVTPAGQVVATLAESQSQPAQAVYSTLDRPLQIAAQEALEGFKGSAIVMLPATGEILALASSPTYDPNLFDPTNRNHEALGGVLGDPGRPLLNRATQGIYPPASVFKIPAVAAALMSGLYQRDSTYTCTGVWNVLGPNAIKYDWTVSFGVAPHGPVNIVEALAYSCDPYFYTVAYDLYNYNPGYMAQVARAFGLGEFTQVGQMAEARGLMPDPDWKLATYGEPWSAGDSVNMGIGQGYVQVTPLQIAQMMAALANGGTLLRPQVVQRIAPPGGQDTFELAPVVNGQLPVTPEQLDLLLEGLRGVTNLPRGTARHIFISQEIPVVGKTGTAEDPAVGPPHAWFAGWTEVNHPEKPDIVIVVMIENIGDGSAYAAPIFRRIAEIYFLGRPYSLYPWESEFRE